MVKKNRNLIIVGTGTFAEFIYKHFEKNANYNVVAFSVEKKFISTNTLHGKPVVPFENIEHLYPTINTDVFVAIGFANMNRVRADYITKAKSKGYKLASYISPNATYFTEEPLEENCFIDDNVVIQPFVKLGKGVIIFAGAVISHHSNIGNFVLIASGAKTGGQCIIEDYSFLGINSVVIENIKIRKGTLVGAGCIIKKNTTEWSAYISSGSILCKRKSYDFF